MKKQVIILMELIIVVLLLVISCKKSDPEPDPVDQDQIAWAVGSVDSNSYGTILKTIDGGETWTRQIDTVLMKEIGFSGLYVMDKNNVWVVGSFNTLLKTTDGGDTWVQVPTPANPSNPNLVSISMLDQNTIWVSGEHGVVMKTLDGGTNWTLFDTNFFHCGLMQGIHVINDQVVYAAGGIPDGGNLVGFFARTLDGGNSWDSISLPDNYNKHEWIGVKATDVNHVIVYGEKGHFANTVDGGLLWYIADPIDPGDINGLVMLSDEIFWAACDFDQIYMTFNGGASWAYQPTADVGPGNQYLVGIDALDTKTALVIGTSAGYPPKGKIMKTTDGGNTWVLKDTTNSYMSNIAYAKE